MDAILPKSRERRTDALRELADAPPKPDSDRILKLLADSYEQSQQIRIGRGEQIRAVLQDRDETWGVGGVRWMEERYGPAATADEVLDFIGKTGEAGPVPILGRMYHRAYTEERELYREMVQALKGHVCWPWLSQVKGIGATLSCKLLARLDPHKAPSASSFWSYCGMGTVPGEEWTCYVCGLTRTWPVGYNVTGKHTALGSTRECAREVAGEPPTLDGITVACHRCHRDVPALVSYMDGAGVLRIAGHCDVCVVQIDSDAPKKLLDRVNANTRKAPNLLVKIAGPKDGVRAAQPKPARGQKASYDQYAKKVMYLVGTGFVKAKGGKFEQVYRKERAKLDRERPGWPDGRKHLTALRKVEKLFLSLLWEVWRKALGLPTPAPYAFHTLGHDESSRIDPWEMVG